MKRKKEKNFDENYDSDSNKLSKKKEKTLDSEVKCKYAGILMYHDRKIFMVQPTGSTGYGIPKGFVEDQEDCESAARREFIEETGIILPMNAKLEYLPGSAVLQGKGVKKIAAYMLEGNGDEKFISSNLIDTGFRKGLPENADGKYLTYADAQQLVHKNQEKLLHLFIERQILLHAMVTRDE